MIGIHIIKDHFDITRNGLLEPFKPSTYILSEGVESDPVSTYILKDGISGVRNWVS